MNKPLVPPLFAKEGQGEITDHSTDRHLRSMSNPPSPPLEKGAVNSNWRLKGIYMIPFEILEHTADVGLRGQGRTLEELFENAAQGLYALALAAPPAGEVTEKVTLHLAGDGPESLLVAFLEELVFRLYSRCQMATSARLSFPSPNRLSAEAAFVPVAAESYAVEVKSPTYHRLKIEQGPDGWLAEVYFDL